MLEVALLCFNLAWIYKVCNTTYAYIVCTVCIVSWSTGSKRPYWMQCLL